MRPRLTPTARLTPGARQALARCPCNPLGLCRQCPPSCPTSYTSSPTPPLWTHALVT